MQKRYVAAAALIAAGLIGTSAFAQNAPSGTGSQPGVVSGSGQNEPGTTAKGGHGTSSKTLKHHETSKKSQNKM